MALNPIGEETLPNGLPVWHFEDPKDKARFSTVDPGLAYTLGAPTPSDKASGFVNPNAGQAPVAPADTRLASAGNDLPTGFATPEELAASAQRPQQVSSPPATGYTAENLPDAGASQAQPEVRSAPPTVSDLVPEQPAVVYESDLAPRYLAGSAGGYSPTGRSTKGIDPNEKSTLQQQADDLYESQLATARAAEQNKRDQLLMDSMQRSVQMGDLRAEQQRQETIAARQEEEKQTVLKRIQDDEQAVAAKHPSMKNVWKNGGTLGVAALFAGLGELGAGLTRSGRNPALDMINRAVEQNLNEQAASIAADKDALGARKNAYAMYLADGHDPKFARLAAKNLALKLEEEHLLDKGVQRQLNNAGVEYMSTVDGLRQERLKTLTELAKLTEVTAAEKYTAPTRGGFETEDQVLKRTLGRAKMRAELGELSGERLTPAERQQVVKDRAAATGGKKGTREFEMDLRSYQSKLQELKIPDTEANITAVRNLAGQMLKDGVQEVPTAETRNIASRAVRGLGNTVLGAGPSILDSEGETKALNRFETTKQAARHAISGSSLTDSEKMSFEEQLKGVNTTQGLQDWADRLQERVDSLKASASAGYGDEVVNAYNTHSNKALGNVRAVRFTPDN